MALELHPKRSKWWYGRVQINGRKIGRNLGVEIRGVIPASLQDTGDAAFERSRAKAQAALEKLQLDLKKRGTAEELVQTIHEIRTGSRVRSIALKDVSTHWKALPRRRALNPRYQKQGESLINRFNQFVTDRHPAVKEMADIQPEMAQAFLRAEVARGASPKTYNSALIFLRSCFGSLRRAAGLVENPFDGIPTREEDTVFRKPFTADELSAIVLAAKKHPFVRPIVITAICTAMRRGDCCLLLKSAVDLPNRFIRVKTSKTGELVQIPIFPLLYEVLADLPKNDSPYVFPAQATKYQANPDYITDEVRRIFRAVGFFNPQEGLSEAEKANLRGEISQSRPNGLRRASVRDFHSFRVTWVTLALSAGVPLEIVQKVTGHRTAGIVMKHYFQPGREEFRRTLAEKLPAIIGGAPSSKTLEAVELRGQLESMSQENWMSVRNALLAKLGTAQATITLSTRANSEAAQLAIAG